MKLYELRQEYEELLTKIDETGEIDNELEQKLEQIEEKFSEKAVNVAKMIQTLQRQSEAVAAERQRLQRRERGLRNAAERLREYLRQEMERVGVREIPGDVLTVQLREGPAKVEIIDPDKVPVAFKAQRWDFDRRGILQAYREGMAVPGVEILRNKFVSIR